MGRPNHNVPEAQPTTWLEIGAVQDIPRPGARTVVIGQDEIAVFRTSDDRVFALSNRCPHRGGPLSEGLVCAHRVVCPLHNWAVELASGEAVAPDEGNTRAYPVRIEEGILFLGLPAAGGG